MKDDALELRRLVSNHRSPADFRAGTGGGRHRDHRCHARHVDPLKVVAHILEIPERTILPGHQRNCLGRIQGRATAEGDNAVMVPQAIDDDTVHDVLPGGITLDRRKHLHRQALVPALLDSGRQHWQSGQSRIGDQQRRRHAQLAAGVGQLGDAARTHTHSGRIVPVHRVLLHVLAPQENVFTKVS